MTAESPPGTELDPPCEPDRSEGSDEKLTSITTSRVGILLHVVILKTNQDLIGPKSVGVQTIAERFCPTSAVQPAVQTRRYHYSLADGFVLKDAIAMPNLTSTTFL